MLADENNILLLFDAGADASYGVFYFGKYVPRPGINPQIPYVMLNSRTPKDPQFNTVNHGAVSYYSDTCDGGICHPAAATGVKICYVDYPTIMQDLKFHPARTTPFFGRFDTFPLVLCINESPYYGVMGTINFFRMCYGVPSLALTTDKKFAIMGHNYLACTKLVVPWDGTTIPGLGVNRVGISF